MTWDRIMTVVLWVVLLVGGYVVYAKTDSVLLAIVTIIAGALGAAAFSQALMMTGRRHN